MVQASIFGHGIARLERVRLRTDDSFDRADRAKAAPPTIRYPQGAQGHPRWMVPEGPRHRAQLPLREGRRDAVFDAADDRLPKMSQNPASQCRPVFVKHRGQAARVAEIDAGGNDGSASDEVLGEPFPGSFRGERDRIGWPTVRRAQHQIVLVDAKLYAEHPERRDAFSED